MVERLPLRDTTRVRPSADVTFDDDADSRGTATIIALAMCGLVVSLQQTLPLPLLSDLPRLIGTSTDNASWVITSTVLTGTVAIPIISRLADMYGKKRLILVTLGVTTAGSVLGAFTDSLPLLIAARSLQGVGLALVPVGIALMRDELPRDRVPAGVALLSSTIALGAAAGLPLAGIIAGHLGWHATFHLTALVGGALFIAVAVTVRESPIRSGGPFDFLGATLLSVALVAAMLALSKGVTWGWSSAQTLGSGLGGLALLSVWTRIQLTAPAPLINIRTAARPVVLLVNIGTILLGYGMFTNMLMTSHILHMPRTDGLGFGMGVMNTGLWMAPVALTFGAAAPLAASLTRRFGPAVTMIAGSAAMAGAYVVRAYLFEDLWEVVLGAMLVASGTSLASAATPVLVIRSVPAAETTSAAGLNTLLRYLGTAISSAAVAAIISVGAVPGVEQTPSIASSAVIFWSAAIASALAGGLALPALFQRMRRNSAEEEVPPASVA